MASTVITDILMPDFRGYKFDFDDFIKDELKLDLNREFKRSGMPAPIQSRISLKIIQISDACYFVTCPWKGKGYASSIFREIAEKEQTVSTSIQTNPMLGIMSALLSVSIGCVVC